MLITIEGSDGCGKSTIGRLVAQALDCKLWEFPNDDTATGLWIRSYLRKEWAVYSEVTPSDRIAVDHLNALAFQALHITNRMEIIPAIKDQLVDHKDVVLVRYWHSSWVYGQIDGLGADWLVKVHAAMPISDLNILLSLSPKESMRRRLQRDMGKDPERYEVDPATYEKVSDLYQTLWKEQMECQKTDDGVGGIWETVSAEQSIEKVYSDTMNRIIKVRDEFVI